MYDRRVKEGIKLGVTAFVLAGGKSSRMGSDKAFLRLGDETLLSQALKLTSAVVSEVCIVGDAKKFAAFGRVVEDVYRERGPLGGIHAALSGSTTELNLMLAVDLPFVTPAFLQYLLVAGAGIGCDGDGSAGGRRIAAALRSLSARVCGGSGAIVAGREEQD